MLYVSANKLSGFTKSKVKKTAVTAAKFLFDGRKFTDTGRALVEKVLLACILEDRQYVVSCKSYTNKILKNIPYFIKAKNYPKEWNYIHPLKQAIQLEDIRSSAGMSKRTFFTQQAMFEKKPAPMDLIIWDLLDLTQPKIKYALVEYDKLVKNQTNSDVMFDVEKVNPVDAMRAFVSGGKVKVSSLADGKAAVGNSASSFTRLRKKPKPTTFIDKLTAWIKKDLANFSA